MHIPLRAAGLDVTASLQALRLHFSHSMCHSSQAVRRVLLFQSW
jgi:hypothetical protein